MKAQSYITTMVVSICLLNTQAHAQGTTGIVKTHENKLVIRNGFEEVEEKADPAQISFTIPEKGQSSFLINGGVSWEFFTKWKNANGKNISNKIAPFAVLQRNNMIDKEQFLYRAGGEFQTIWGKDNPNKILNNYINTTASYLHDRIDTSHSALITCYYTIFKGGVDNTFRLNNIKNFGTSRIAYFVSPSAGLEGQQKFASKTDSIGFQGRIYFDVDASIIYRAPSKIQKNNPLATNEMWPKYVELSIGYTMRYNFVNTIADADKFIPLFKPKLSFYPTHDDNLSLALSYNIGADPIAGLKYQKFWMLALTFQIK